jgi:hypothetical protein
MMLSKTGTNFNLSFKTFINLNKDLMTKYSKEAGNKVEKAMHEEKNGTLKNGRSGKIVTNPKQAIAIGLSEARKEGAKVPKKAAVK